MGKLKVFFGSNKLWIATLQYVAYAILLLSLVILSDLGIIPVHKYLHSFLLMSVDFSQSILIALAAAFLTITTFTFSTILTVLNMYASNFSPRIVENFINMKTTLRVIGIFIGGFIFCVGALLVTRGSLHNELAISGAVAILYSILSIAYFIVFVNNVMTKFQGVNIIKDLSNTAKAVNTEEITARKQEDNRLNTDLRSVDLLSEKFGYLSFIDFEAIANHLKDCSGDLVIKAKIGQYVTEDSLLATLYSDYENLDNKEKILEYFILQDQKMDTIDYRYNMSKLLDIALRAISPGINDPNTAIHCINKLGTLLADFASIDRSRVQHSQTNNFTIYYETYSFDDDLKTFFLPLIQYGKDDLQVILSILNSLEIIYYNSTTPNQKHILSMIDHIKQKIKDAFKTDMEKSLLKTKFSHFEEHIMS